MLSGPDGHAVFLQPTIMEEVNSSMMLYFKTLTHCGFPLLSLNKYSDLDYVENFMKSGDALIGGSRYLDQVMVLSDDKNIVRDIQKRVSIPEMSIYLIVLVWMCKTLS